MSCDGAWGGICDSLVRQKLFAPVKPREEHVRCRDKNVAFEDTVILHAGRGARLRVTEETVTLKSA